MSQQSKAVSRPHAALLASALVGVLCAGSTLGCKSSPLVDPVILGQAEDVARLLTSGSDPNGTDYKGRNLLELAILKQHIEVVQLLVDKGADINLVGDYGNTPIAWTA